MELLTLIKVTLVCKCFKDVTDSVMAWSRLWPRRKRLNDSPDSEACKASRRA